MMNKKKHVPNAFSYTCWGANLVLETNDELGTDEYGYLLIGCDGDQHYFPEGYHLV